MNPLISVIVPIYNVEAYLPRCLDSIVNQTYRNLEIVLVDDGSPDNCDAICDDYALRDHRIRVIHKENGGVSSARNTGLDIMQGQYLMFVDSDDWISPDAVQALYERLIRDDSDMAIGHMVKVFDDGSIRQVYYRAEDAVLTKAEALRRLGLTGDIPCYPVNKLYRREIFSKLRYRPISRAEDVWILPHVLDACDTISLDSRVLYYYYQRSTSIVHNSKDPQLLESAAATLYVSRFLLERELWDNAAVYAISALRQLQLVQNKKNARKLEKDAFTWQEWIALFRCCPKCFLFKLGLCMPSVYTAAYGLRRRLRSKGDCRLWN